MQRQECAVPLDSKQDPKCHPVLHSLVQEQQSFQEHSYPKHKCQRLMLQLQVHLFEQD